MHYYRIILAAISLGFARFAASKAPDPDPRDPNIVVGSIGFKRLSQLTELCEANGDFLFRTNDVQLRMNPEVFECLSKIRLNGTLEAAALTSLSVKQWALWEVDRFGLRDPVNWVPGTVATCGGSRDSFLGGPCNLASGGVKRFYSHLPPHSEVKLTGRVHFFDEWNDASVMLKADERVLWTESHNWCPGVTDSACRKFGVDVCGTEYPDRLSVYFEVSMQHSAPSLAVEFSSTLPASANPCEVSWGIDDVALHLR